MACDAMTDGDLVPSVKLLRDRADKEGPQTANVTDALRAIDGWKVPGHRPLRYRILRTVAEVRRAVSVARAVHICVSYRVMNALLERTGDPAFAGGHSMLIVGSQDGKWRMFDPLDDSRRPEIPQGPRLIRAEHLIAAMEAFAGGPHRAWAGVFTGGGKQR
jgi:hypothetical protein